MKLNQRILILSDTHFPFHNKNYWNWIKKIKDRIKPTRVIHIGDLVDNASIQVERPADPNVESPVFELASAKKEIRKLEKLFPKMDILFGNHDLRIMRRAERFGIPRSMLKDLNTIYEIKSDWRWHDKLIVKLPNRTNVFFTHNFKSNILASSKELGCSFVCGHWHTISSISLWSNPLALNFAMCVGSSINPKAASMRYQKNFIKRPIISVGAVIDSVPQLFPMPL
ncbi:MAG: metallophosphoesterase [SAR324 cluster bacterium]|nr:metallophosphoesterase [SAR324 cluster bacterium]|tara:strand:+ start:580 stop:1257 length:678 start_codon:yes stop_codon:yes gene_type:complete